MIAFSQNLPIVKWSEDRNIALDEEWIIASIYQSAELAGYYDWEMCGHVAKAILFFLRRDFQGNCLSAEQLEAIMRRSISGIGYPEIAACAQLIAPRVNIYLPDIARQAPYEILFFPTLRERLSEAKDILVSGIRLEGLRSCVKILENCKKWRPACQRLSEDIVVFARQHLQTQEDELGIELVIC
ncbi:MAG: hypothetical protein ACOY3I_03340 [Verrucomicrobiota bacterium]